MNTFQREIGSLQRRQHLLYILLFSFVTVIIWIGVSLIGSQRRTGIDPTLLQLATPLNPTINNEIISQIEQKRAYSDEELSNFPIYRIVTNQTNGGESIVDIRETPTDNQSPLAAPTEPNPSPEGEAGSTDQPATSETAAQTPESTTETGSETPSSATASDAPAATETPTAE